MTTILDGNNNHTILFDNDMTRGDSNDGETQDNFLLENYKMLGGALVVLSAILVVVSFWLREVCYDRCGIEFCSGTMTMARRREIRRNQVRAIQLQRQMDRDMLDSSVSKQEERKRISGAYLKNFSKILTQADIAVEQESSDESNVTEAQRTLKLCPHESDPCKQCVVEATCIICFKDYEEGERVVWSSREGCCHVFHMECMLKWISTGKHKCPICRNWFIPDIEDMKQLPVSGTTLGNSDPMSAESSSSPSRQEQQGQYQGEEAV